MRLYRRLCFCAWCVAVWQSTWHIAPHDILYDPPPRAADPIRCCCCWLRWLPSSLLPLSLECMCIIPERFTGTRTAAAVYFRTRQQCWFPTYESICFFFISSWLFVSKEALFALDLSVLLSSHHDYLITPSVCVWSSYYMLRKTTK